MQFTLAERAGLYSLAFLGFMLYAIAAIDQMPSQPQAAVYTKRDRAQMDDLIAKVTAPRTVNEKIIYLYGGQ